MLIRRLASTVGPLLYPAKDKQFPSDPERIAIIRSGGIGDILMSTPLVAAVRTKWPKARITYVVGEWSAPAIRTNKDIDSLITFPDRIIFSKDLGGIRSLAKRLKKERFELGFILDKAWEFGVLASMSGIGYRVGFDRRGEGFAHQRSVPFDGTKHELEYYRDLAKTAGITKSPSKMSFYPTQKDEKDAQRAIKQHELNPKKLIILMPGGAKNPGQEMAEKRWPAERYGNLADALSSRGFQVALLGAQGDSAIHQRVKQSTKQKPVDLCGELSLGGSYCLLKQARLVITHDSGPMHLAAAAGVPLIALFGPTPAKRFAPAGATVISKGTPSYTPYGASSHPDHTMAKIQPDEVLKAALANFIKKPAKRRV